MTPHIESGIDDISRLVLMPGDPKRAKYIADNFLLASRQVNSVRGEDAYTGYYKNKRITVFSSGMGIASMGIYSYELFSNYNVDVIIRVGTAGAYSDDLKLRDILIVNSAYSETNYDEEATAKNVETVNASFEIISRLEKDAALNRIKSVTGRVHTSEAFYNARNDFTQYMEKGCLGVEMECFALFLNAKKFNKKAGAVLSVTDEKYSNNLLTSEEREKSLNEMITLALETIIKL